MKAVKTETAVCKVFCVDKKKVARLRSGMEPDGVLRALAQTFKVLGDPTRIKIMFALSKKELCVCELSALLGAGQSAVSHQLRVLRNMSLVKYRRTGKLVHYSLDDRHISNLFSEGLRHVKE